MKQLCCPLVEIVVSVAYAWRAPDTPFLLPFRPRFIAHRARSDSIALAGYPARFKSLPEKKRDRPKMVCLFFWRRRRDLKGFTPTRKHSRLGHRRVAHARYSLFSPLSRSLHPPQAAVALQALAGNPSRKEFKSFDNKKTEQTVWSALFFWRRRRDLNSRAGLYPTYTLSRGASSANLSTSPYIK